MNIVCCAYRKWALDIINNVKQLTNHNFMIIKSPKELDYNKIKKFNPNYILFYGWSWYINKKYRNLCTNVVLHNAPLPKYRGGSPIQHQILNNEKISAVTLFIPDDGIDTGDILLQEEFSLEGNLYDIFNRITYVGIKLTLKLLRNEFKIKKQDDSESSYYKRRTPDMSELKLDDFKNKTSIELYNFIRMLQYPYPNAYYVCKDGKRLYFKGVEIDD